MYSGIIQGLSEGISLGKSLNLDMEKVFMLFLMVLLNHGKWIIDLKP
jgi:hypothetical protein